MPRFPPAPGMPLTLAPGLRLLLAPNPSPMTQHGTNTYLVGGPQVMAIDPGPDIPDHLAAIMSAVGEARLTHILVTHAHVDHSPLARALSAATGAPVLAFGDSRSGRSAVMRRLAQRGLAGGGQGVDHDFAPDVALSDGEVVSNADVSLRAHHMPGHMGNHMCFQWGDRVFSGDLVMGWASSLVSPPDGDLTDFMASLDRLRALTPATLHPGHGAAIADPVGRIDGLIRHRREREAQIVAALDRPATVTALTARVYTDTPSALLPAAARNVLAHLVALHQTGRVTAEPQLAADATFRRSESDAEH